MKKKIIASVTAFILVGISVCLIIFLPNTKNEQMLENKFLNEKSEYQGVITLWNIDTFESGTASKSSFLEKMAINFEKENRGIYILVKNMTIDECLLQLEQGNKPDLFSYGEGLFDILKPYFGNGLDNVEIKNIIQNNGKDLSIAKPWCFGFYSLISTSKNLEKSGNDSNTNLIEIIDNCSYEKKLKRSTKHISSYVYGGAEYTNIKAMLSNLSKTVEGNDNTFFEAYEQFINGNASILCGSQRDIVRMENRVKVGKIDSYLYDCIFDYTDLVQYLSYVPNKNSLMNKYSKKFINFMLSIKVQENLSKISMCAARNGVIANAGNGVFGDIEIKFS